MRGRLKGKLEKSEGVSSSSEEEEWTEQRQRKQSPTEASSNKYLLLQALNRSQKCPEGTLRVFQSDNPPFRHRLFGKKTNGSGDLTATSFVYAPVAQYVPMERHQLSSKEIESSYHDTSFGKMEKSEQSDLSREIKKNHVTSKVKKKDQGKLVLKPEPVIKEEVGVDGDTKLTDAKDKIMAGFSLGMTSQGKATAATVEKEKLFKGRQNKDVSSLEPNRAPEVIGRRVQKYFPNFGLFEGVIQSVRTFPTTGEVLFLIVYTDGDAEEMTEAEVKARLIPSS